MHTRQQNTKHTITTLWADNQPISYNQESVAQSQIQPISNIVPTTILVLQPPSSQWWVVYSVQVYTPVHSGMQSGVHRSGLYRCTVVCEGIIWCWLDVTSGMLGLINTLSHLARLVWRRRGAICINFDEIIITQSSIGYVYTLFYTIFSICCLPDCQTPI